uniref:Transmembrane protein n=1 Tax=Ditylum brightwellii TaxID=49249 RepID=A0A7S2ESL3_9STRA|mmetsp:Transcript_5347/g.8126  ORF Transcript_5347/g.8126 Transcript_5347/m.8126 type:complete len:434 (+) Transcript_5347:808-2109(+)
MQKSQRKRTRRECVSNMNTSHRHTGHQRIKMLAVVTVLTLLFALPIEAAISAVTVEGVAPTEDTLAEGKEVDGDTQYEGSEPNQPSTQQTHYCRWGDKDCHHRESPTNENRSATYKSEQQMADTIGSVIKKAAAMSSDTESVHAPPEGFTLAARVLTDHDTGLSYFAPLSSPSDLQIPFLECGAVGSTTEPIEIKHGTFRHFPSGADPSSFTTSPHAQLVVALHPLELTVSGNKQESRVFHPGDVILLEDTMGKGHKMRALSSGEEKGQYGEERDLSVFMLTLPHHHHHHHEKGNSNIIANHMSVFGLGGHPKPCENELDPAYTTLLPKRSDRNGGIINPFRRENIHKVLFGGIGASLSSVAVVKLFKVVPMLMSVGFGTACLVGGGTCAIVWGGEALMDEYSMRCEEKRYRMNTEHLGDDDDDTVEDDTDGR